MRCTRPKRLWMIADRRRSAPSLYADEHLRVHHGDRVTDEIDAVFLGADAHTDDPAAGGCLVASKFSLVQSLGPIWSQRAVRRTRDGILIDAQFRHEVAREE